MRCCNAQYVPRRLGAGRVAATVALVILVAFAGLVPGAESAPMEKVKVRLSFTPFAAHVQFYVAQASGFYAENGLDVEILSGRGSSFAAQVVGSGNEQFGLADAAAVLVAAARGIPLVSLGNTQQDSGVALFATVKSGITDPCQIKGRKVGIFQGSVTEIYLKALLAKCKITINDISPVITRPGSDLPLVLDGRIEAEVTVFNNELIQWQIQHPDLKMRIWKMRDLGFEAPGYSLITNETLLRSNPAQARAFVRATFKGLEFALRRPEEATDALIKAIPELNRTVELAKLRAMNPTATNPVTEERGLGAHDIDKWESLLKLLRTYEVIKPNEPVNLGRLLRDQYRR